MHSSSSVANRLRGNLGKFRRLLLEFRVSFCVDCGTMFPFELQKPCVKVTGESIKCISFLPDLIEPDKILLYLGMNKGTLRVYHINYHATLPNTTKPDYKEELICQVVITRKRPIRKIVAVGGPVQGVIVLCEGKVSLHHLRQLTAIQHFDQHVEATEFSVDKTSQKLSKLCVADKRTVVIYEYIGDTYVVLTKINFEEVY